MELALVFALQLVGAFVAVALARPLVGLEPSASVERVAAAAGRATRSFTWRALARAAALALLAAGVLGAAAVGTGQAGAALPTACGILAGAALAAVTGLLAELAGTRASTAVLVALQRRFDGALTTSLRAAGAVGVASQALAVIGALGVVAVAHWAALPDASRSVLGAVAALPGYVLGAALVALTFAESAGPYVTSARAAELRASVAAGRHDDAHNPALVSVVVGERLEHTANAARLFALSSAGATVALTFAAGDGADLATFSRRAAFPLLLWAFGLIANSAGLFAARALEAEGAGPALARGQASTAAVWLFGLVGAGYWLAPEVWPPLAGAAALGFVGAAVAPWSLVLAARRQDGPLRDALESLRGGAAPAATSSVGFGLSHAALGLAGLVIVALAAARLGAHAGALGEPRYVLLLAFFGATAWSPYALAVGSSAGSAETARRIGALAAFDSEVLQRAQRLGDTHAIAGSIARSQASFAAGLAALTATWVLAQPFGSPESAAGAGWMGVLGAAWTLAAAGRSARRAARGAREATLEVERQVAPDPLENPGETRVPSYRGCEEVAGRAGLGGTFQSALRVFLGPVVLGIALKVVYRESGPRLAAEALATFVAGAAVTALGVALTVDGARAVLAGARRANRPEGDPATYAASVTGDALSDTFRGAVSPTVCTLSLIATALVLLARTILS